jgi:hypothetical protein
VCGVRLKEGEAGRQADRARQSRSSAPWLIFGMFVCWKIERYMFSVVVLVGGEVYDTPPSIDGPSHTLPTFLSSQLSGLISTAYTVLNTPPSTVRHSSLYTHPSILIPRPRSRTSHTPKNTEYSQTHPSTHPNKTSQPSQ